MAAKEECARSLLEAYPDVRIEWLESVHDIPIHRPRELARLLRSFVSGLSERTSPSIRRISTPRGGPS